MEIVTRLELGLGFNKNHNLHRENRAQAIYASLAIEGNSLSLNEVTAVIKGNAVVGTQAEIKEVKNAYEAYGQILGFDPYSTIDFLKAHQLMTVGLIKEAGKFRSGDVGVFDGDRVAHIGARPRFVPGLIEELFEWAKKTTLHPVLKSAALHYEIEIIHPFADGNGRMGRLWQTLVLAKWKSLFQWVPLELFLYEKRPEYYQAIESARKVNDSGVFIEFALAAILDAVKEREKRQERRHDQNQRDLELSKTHLAILKALKTGDLSRKEIFASIGQYGDTRSFSRNITPLLNEGLIELTHPDKPNSEFQKYRLNDKGKTVISP
ncbi:MAG: Fic family protein [Deltaproteobacteria bacterium]|nr:Fic family protein [Deltaproteobacteria bacterium]